MRLVQEGDALARDRPCGEAVVADNVAGQAGRAADPHRHAALDLAQHRRTVRRLDDVGHVAGGRDVGDGDGHAVVEGVEDLADQDARIERDGLTSKNK